jgi:hypothetical protein
MNKPIVILGDYRTYTVIYLKMTRRKEQLQNFAMI